ncbi:zinc finger protein [Plasmodium yoelii yoelii]|uniref:Zinc finger protein n=1 Tax=Plasmodium yoelii yoelii TaxID=73239 RepID=A0AAF0B4G1_PLAYO|nr:zinc finger protein [Plasmodium yoelii yoelii]
MNKNKKKEKLKRKKKHTNSNLNLCKEINDNFTKLTDKSPNNKKEICNNNTNELGTNNNDSSKKIIISSASNPHTPENVQCVNKEGEKKKGGKKKDEKKKGDKKKGDIVQNGDHADKHVDEQNGDHADKHVDEQNGQNNFEIKSDEIADKGKRNQHDDISPPVLKKIENKKTESKENSKVSKDEIYNLVNLNNMEEIEKNINYIFPSINFDNNSNSNKLECIENVKNDDKKFEDEINKEIKKFQKDIKDVYFYHNNLKKGMKKNKCVNYENNMNHLNSTSDINLKNIILENEFVNFSEILIKGNNFLNLKKKIIKKKKKRKKKKNKTKLRTQNYKLIKELCLSYDAYTKETIQKQRKNEKKVRKYYIFEYSCGNTKIQSITGYIICYKSYEFYKNGINVLKIKPKEGNIFGKEGNIFGKEGNIFGKDGNIFGKDGNIFGKDGNIFGKDKNEKNISVLLCVNVSNCISPSGFLELLYPCDNFIFFLKVLNKKNSEEYMIYFLTFNIYTKKILNKAKKISFFNMKKKKKLKIYIVKGITMNVTSCITRNTNSDSYVKTKKFYNIDLEKKTMCANDDNDNDNDDNIENLQLISNTNLISPFYLISQNKFQLSCAVCLEPLYSVNLNKIISHIFNFSFKKKYSSKNKYNKEENKLQTYPSKYYYKNLNLLNNYNMNKYAYHLSVTNLINNLQNKYNNEMKKEREKNDKNRSKIFNNIPINILCSHIFHSSCLKKCCFTSCPICRYKQYNYEIANCDICKKNYNSKICLSCGFIGCSFNYDKIVKIKKKKIKEKKYLLKKKKNIIKKISYIFRKLINSFMPIFNTIILSLYYKSKIKCVYKIRTKQIYIPKKKKKKYISTNYNHQTNYITYYSDNHNKNKKIINYKYPNPQNNNDTQNEKTTNNNLSLFSNNDNIYINDLKKFYKYIYIGKSANKKKNVSYYFSQNINKCIIKKDAKKKKNDNKCKLQNKFGSTNAQENNETELKKGMRNEMGKEMRNEMGKEMGNEMGKEMGKEAANEMRNSATNVVVEKYTKCSLKKKKKKIKDHAKIHFYKTQHNYFFDVRKNSIYDYSSDIYIKKLINLKIQNKKFKNIYNTGNIYTNGNNSNPNKEIINKKNIILYIYDFNQLLNALLESQRNSFLSCIHDLKINYENINMDNLNDINKCVKEIYILQEKNNNLKNEIKKKINILIDKIKTNNNLSRELKNVETINAKLSADQRKQIYNYDLKNEQKKNMIKEKQQIIKELNKQVNLL